MPSKNDTLFIVTLLLSFLSLIRAPFSLHLNSTFCNILKNSKSSSVIKLIYDGGVYAYNA